MEEKIKEAFDVVNDFLAENGYAMAIVKRKSLRNTVVVRNPNECDSLSEHWFGVSFGRTDIRKRRYDLGISQTELAKLVGVNQRTISRLEDDKVCHSEVVLQKAANFFGCKVADLLIDEADIELAKKREDLPVNYHSLVR